MDDNYNQLYKNRFWVIGGIILLMVLAVVVFLWLSNRDRNANLEIISVPDDAVFVIDGQRLEAGKHRLDSGEYEIKAERQGFESMTQRVELGTELKQVLFSMTPVSEEAKRWAQDHKQDYLDLEAIGGELSQQQGQEFAERYPIVARLPYSNSLMSINYTKDVTNPDNIYIRIDTTGPAARQVALAQIREWGYNPTDYDIVFAGAPNPFDPSIQEAPGE